jgi:hypothetical protein
MFIWTVCLCHAQSQAVDMSESTYSFVVVSDVDARRGRTKYYLIFLAHEWNKLVA